MFVVFTEEIEEVAAVGVAAGGAAEEGLAVGEAPRGVREVVRHGEQEVARVRERVPEAEYPVEAHPSGRQHWHQHHRRHGAGDKRGGGEPRRLGRECHGRPEGAQPPIRRRRRRRIRTKRREEGEEVWPLT